MYTSNLNEVESEKYWNNETRNNETRNKVTLIKINFRDACNKELSLDEIKNALFSMKKGKSPGSDGLSVEFYVHFWDILNIPLFNMYKDCIRHNKMIPTMN